MMRSTRNGPRLIDAATIEASTDPAVAAPPNFDPLQFPILAVHFFGHRQPASRSAEITDFGLVRLATALHRLGVSIGADVGGRGDVLKRITPQTHETQRDVTLVPGGRQ